MNIPALHGKLMGVHALPFSVEEYDEWSAQAPHTRSDESEPGYSSPWPAGHSCQASHFWFPAAALKCLAGHSAHVRSLLNVAARSMNSPISHGELTATHASPLALLE
jgi:hypothetical protein